MWWSLALCAAAAAAAVAAAAVAGPVSATLVAAVAAAAAWRLLRQDAVDRLPGPRRWPLFGNIFTFIGMDPETMFVRLREYRRLYGDRYLVQVFSRRIIHVSHPDDVELVLSSSKNISKSLPYSFLEPWLGTGLIMSKGAKWHKRRRILTPAFHFNILKNFTRTIEEKSQQWVEELRREVDQPLDLQPRVSAFTLHTICETAMGTRLDSDQSKAAKDYKEAILEIGPLALGRLTKMWLRNDLVFHLSGAGRRFRQVLKRVHSFADGVIMERMKNRTEASTTTEADSDDERQSKRRPAMLDLLLDAEGRGDIDLEGVREEVNTVMFAGHDTTAMAIMFALYALSHEPEVQERIFEELASGDAGRRADYSRLKYLEAVIKETLRLYPSVPFISRRITEPFMLGDVPVPASTEVAVHIYDLHRRADLYPQPELFRPERWLRGGGGGGGGGASHPYGFVPFSAGPRNCIGLRFAMQEMKCVLSAVCRAYRVRPVPAPAPRLVSDLVLRPLGPVLVRLELR